MGMLITMSGLDRDVGPFMKCILAEQQFHYSATCQPQSDKVKICGTGTNTYKTGSAENRCPSS